jgi:UDP-glucose 4-epimerase
MKVLVTGGCGFIGSHITDELINTGNDVVVVDNLSTGNIDNLNKKAKLYKVDITSEELEEVFKDFKPEVVYHEAAQIDVQRSIKDPVFDFTADLYQTPRFLNIGYKAFGIRQKNISNISLAIRYYDAVLQHFLSFPYVNSPVRSYRFF